MTNPTPNWKEELEIVLEREFPKGKCKERGGALVLFAEAVHMIERVRLSTLDEALETQPKIIERNAKQLGTVHLMRPVKAWNIGFRFAQQESRQAIEALKQKNV